LPFGARAPRRIDLAVDGVRERFGTAAITRGVLLGRGEGMTVPMLPD
jgi:DNA polymerase-4